MTRSIRCRQLGGALVCGLLAFLVTGTGWAQSNTFPSNGNAGVGTLSPPDAMSIIGGGATGPATSGATPKGFLMVKPINSSGMLELGFGNTFGWLQSHDITDQTANYPLLLNPNGGSVAIGTPNAQDALSVVGRSAADPAASGTGLTGILLLKPANSSGSLEAGFGNTYSWLQSKDTSNQAVNYPLTLNPNGGNVGVGTANPAAKLHVAGDAQVDGNLAAKYQDVAEWVHSSVPLSSGVVVVVDAANRNQVLPASAAYDTRVAGVVSARPGLLLGEAGDSKVKVAHSGRVRVKVDASYAPVAVGDLLVTSPTTGYAMRSIPLEVGGVTLHRPGTLLGKALEPLDAGQGEILVLVTLQ
jgi:hypothetical protein